MTTPLNAKESERYLICPYNPAHEILAGRMQTHLVKCKKNYPDAKIVECIYNSTHRVPEPEINYHHENCRDRVTLDKYVLVPEEDNVNKYPVPSYQVAVDGEFWDDENHPTYNPIEHIVDKPILRNCQVQSASVRRNFRNEQRQKFQQMQSVNNGQEPDMGSESDAPERAQVRRPTVQSAAARKNAKDITEDDPESVAKLLEKVHLSKASGPKDPSALKVQNATSSTSGAKGSSDTNAKSSSEDKDLNEGGSGASGREPWTAAEIARKAAKPRAMGRGRCLKTNNN